MAAYYKVDVVLNSQAVLVGLPSPQSVSVTLPLVGPAGPVGSVGPAGPQGAQGVPGTGLEVLTTQGDLLYQGVSTGQRLPIGTSGQVLKVSGGIPAWANESGAVTSVNGATGAVTITPASIDAANESHDHQPSDVFADAAFVTQSGGSGTHGGIYIRNGSDNSKPVYENTSTRNYIWWDSDLSKWFLTTGADVNLYEKSSSASFPWQATGQWSAVSPQAGNVEVDQANLFDVSDAAASNVIGLKTAKTGNASSTQVVLGSDTRLSDSRTPSSTLAHASTHHTGGTDAIAPENIGARSKFGAISFVNFDVGTLPPARAKVYAVVNFASGTANLSLPNTGSLLGDEIVVRSSDWTGGVVTIGYTSDEGFLNFDNAFRLTATGQQYSFICIGFDDENNAGWTVVRVDTHTHAASAINSGTLDVARLPVGTGSTQVAAGNHTHVVADVTGAAASGSITTSGLTQATARILGRTTASTGAIEEIQIGSGLSLSAGELSATGGSGGGEVRSDFVSPYTYTGLADAGTSESTASWTIRRSEFDAGGSFVATLTASAVEWDDRLTASYA
jgi:hypothetical protein